jgi:D-amino-acid oxidase
MAEAARRSRRAVITGLAGLGVAGLSGCASSTSFTGRPLPPVRLQMSRLDRITVCLRPFRAAGPRLEVESLGDKRVVHNYGHGGSGWSLAWGSSTVAAGMALEGGTRDVAVIGCGALGLTSALLLRRAGAGVTIYAKERLPQSRSARATGTWSPDSRIAASDKVAPGFPAQWEEMARTSYATYQTYIGLPGEPVTMSDRYVLDDGGTTTPTPQEEVHFASYGRRLAGLTPPYRTLSASENPFPVAEVRMGSSMQFNIAALGQRLMDDFQREGGRIVEMSFATPADLLRLPEPVVVNCTGYGARALWNDQSIIPVRGQIAWLLPQPEVRYGLFYRHVVVLPHPEGIVVQDTGPSDMYGYGNDNEMPDRREAETAISTVAPLFRRSWF